MRYPLIFVFALFLSTVRGQSYFPPSGSSSWDSISPSTLGWCIPQLDSLNQFLDTTGTRAFIILVNGRIAHEVYFNGHNQNLPWYWASAGKTVTGFLVGCAQEDGSLSINDPTSSYLGMGWTSLSASQEQSITLRHQLTMTSGLDDNVPDPDCLIDTCLTYLAPAGTRWAYHNAPYRLLQDVVDSAVGPSFQQFTQTRLKDRIGMGSGTWLNYVFWSRPRDMARFGLLMENEGIWAGDSVMRDRGFFHDMIHPSQNLNKSYGYLFWLNGQPSFMVPQIQIVFPGPLIPNAPSNLFAGLGKNDQKLYILPDEDMVIVRMGDPGLGGNQPVPIAYDVLLWEQLNKVFCGTVGLQENEDPAKSSYFYPTPTMDRIWFSEGSLPGDVRIFDALGQERAIRVEGNAISLKDLESGMYWILWHDKGHWHHQTIAVNQNEYFNRR